MSDKNHLTNLDEVAQRNVATESICYNSAMEEQLDDVTDKTGQLNVLKQTSSQS